MHLFGFQIFNRSVEMMKSGDTGTFPLYYRLNRQRLESQGIKEDERTTRTIAQVLNITQKVPEPVIRLKGDVIQIIKQHV